MDFRGISSFCLFLLLLVTEASVAVRGRRFLVQQKPNPADSVATARWLVSQNSWGFLSIISSERGGAPFGKVVSFSDGLPDQGRGIPYFYLTTLDPIAKNALKDERSSFAVSALPLGSCANVDPQNPTCSKLTLTGKLKLVNRDSEEGKFAKSALLSKHAEMKGWPLDHDFQIFKLEIADIFLINGFGGAKPITVDQYLHPGKYRLISSVFPSSLF